MESQADLRRYKKYELTSRFAWLYTSVAVAGALSGLLAGLITDYMDGAAGIRGWRWLFVSVSEPIASVTTNMHRSSRVSHLCLPPSWCSSSCPTSQPRSHASFSQRKNASSLAIAWLWRASASRKAHTRKSASGRPSRWFAQTGGLGRSAFSSLSALDRRQFSTSFRP
jgi:MFS family permease